MYAVYKAIPAALLLMVVTAATSSNWAQAKESAEKGGEAKEMQLFSQATISLSDAINAAEQATGGKAMEAEVDDESNSVQFEIEVVKAGKIHKVMIDGKTGNIVKAALDHDDKEGEAN